MDITVDTAAHQYSGSMKVVLEQQARNRLTKRTSTCFSTRFSPAGVMDVRSRTNSDPDRRVGSRIFERA